MAFKSETPDEARQRLLGMSEQERAGSQEIAADQAHEGFVKDQQQIAQDVTEAFAPLDELEMERRELTSRANVDVIRAEREEAAAQPRAAAAEPRRQPEPEPKPKGKG